ALEEARRVTRPGGTVLVVGPDYPSSKLFQRLADAIMLFYDAEEADRMFAAAGFEEFEHHVQQRSPGAPRAITTVARVPQTDADASADGGASSAMRSLRPARST
ncbi:MAG: SAM-dependent methyltransferase, partial [Gemmatimonadota bacterium]